MEIGQRQLNRALLARQLLLERASLPLPEALERIGGIQAQYAPSMYIGLWSRLTAFERDTLTDALNAHTVVQGTLMRSTIHLVSPTDYWPFALATRAARRQLWLRSRPEPDDAAMQAAAQRLEAALDAGALRRTEVEALIGKEEARSIHNWTDLVRAPPSGTWERRRADLYTLARDWLGEEPQHEDEFAAMEHLVRRYLAAFGPATRKDVQSFTGLSLTTLKPVLERIGPVRHDGELLDLPGAPLPDPDTPAPPRYLPTFDATLLVHARRTQILPERYRERIFNTKTPHSKPTFLVDGAVAGTWSLEDGRITRDEFERLDAADRRALDEEGERLASLVAS